MAGVTIDDTTPIEAFHDTSLRPGLELPEGFQGPADYAGVATPFPRNLVLSWDTLKELARERKARKATHRDVARQAGLRSKNQQRTNYCWINSPAYCVEYVRVRAGLQHVPLSPASGGGPIKNFRNQGGYGRQALQWIEERGLVPSERWPDNAIDPAYYTDANRALALYYRVTEWWVFEPGDLQAVLSCILGLDNPVSVGLNWWRHQVSYTGAEEQDGQLWPEFRNSYGDEWQDDGYAVLKGDRARPDDAVAPAVAVAS